MPSDDGAAGRRGGEGARPTTRADEGQSVPFDDFSRVMPEQDSTDRSLMLVAMVLTLLGWVAMGAKYTPSAASATTWVLFLVATCCVYVGGWMVVAASPMRRLRRRIAATKTVSIRDSGLHRECRTIRIVGRIRASEGGLLTAPFSGRQAVWARIIVCDLRDNVRIEEVSGRDFLLDGRDGGTAQIASVATALVLYPGETDKTGAGGVLSRAPVRTIPPRMMSFMQSRGLAAEGDITDSDYVIEELVLEPGDEIVAVGRAEYSPATIGTGDAHAVDEPVVTLTKDGGEPVILVRDGRRPFHETISWAVLAVGAALTGLWLIVAQHSR